MAWLESLAARQGAKAEELTTAHNIDIPVLPPDTVIDEPGYTPGYDTGKQAAGQPKVAQAPEPAKAAEPVKPVEPVKVPEPVQAPPPSAPAVQPEPVAAPAGEDQFANVDPMAWLESLAA